MSDYQKLLYYISHLFTKTLKRPKSWMLRTKLRCKLKLESLYALWDHHRYQSSTILSTSRHKMGRPNKKHNTPVCVIIFIFSFLHFYVSVFSYFDFYIISLNSFPIPTNSLKIVLNCIFLIISWNGVKFCPIQLRISDEIRRRRKCFLGSFSFFIACDQPRHVIFLH